MRTAINKNNGSFVVANDSTQQEVIDAMDLFNDATTREIGSVGPDQVTLAGAHAADVGTHHFQAETTHHFHHMKG
jgi:hypothetical protein